MKPEQVAQVVKAGRGWLVTRNSATLADSDYEHVAREIADALNKRHAYPKLVAALAGLFEHCAMIHKHWGDGNNSKQADAAQNAARALLHELGELS